MSIHPESYDSNRPSVLVMKETSEGSLPAYF